MNSLIKSLIIAIIVSFCAAFALSNVLGFWQTFVGSLMLQYVVSAIWSTYGGSKIQDIEREYTQIIDDILEDITIIVKCPCGKSDLETVSNPNKDIIVECEVCLNKIRIQHIIEPVLVSQEVDIESVYDKLLSEKKAASNNS
jgi:hypothetical protein